ncbi:TPA: hypothetical protein HA318_02165 [Candidatus Micrarchaeota archaeon]|nr:MAG: hypothetical protein AUJ65_05695 [Candidatus Micrarchaeota archaeon CG1_02_51_15]HII38783.1 hypothetical protein [Candidatus Micrarchaeota archaeon]
MKLRKAQTGIEFFFVTAFVLLLAIYLVTASEGELTQTKNLNRVAVAKSVTDAVSQAVNTVALEGNGSTARIQQYVPADTLCLLYNTTSKKLFCIVSGVGTVSGTQLYSAPAVSQSCFPSGDQGWMLIKINNSGAGVGVWCTQTG